MTGLIFKNFKNEKTHSFIFLWMVFLFPAIALLNFFTGIQNSMLSYGYRGCNLLLAFFLIALPTASVINRVISGTFRFRQCFLKKETIAFLLLLAFWIFYLYRVYTDIACHHIFLIGNDSLYYYLLFAIGVTLIPSLAAPGLRIYDFSLFTFWLNRLLQTLCLLLFIIYFVILFCSDKPVFRYILAWKEFEYLDAISISVTGALLIFVSAFQKPLNSLSVLWIVLGGFLMAAAASRSPYISLIITLGFAFYKRKENLRVILLIIVSVFAGFLIHMGLTSIFKEIFTFGNPLLDRWINYENDQSYINRTILLSEGWKQFTGQPIWGSHFFVVSQGLYVHNLILDVLLSEGIFGWILLAFPFLLYLKKFLSGNSPLILLCLSLFYLMNAMTSGAVYNLNEFWYLFMYVTFGSVKQDELNY